MHVNIFQKPQYSYLMVKIILQCIFLFLKVKKYFDFLSPFMIEFVPRCWRVALGRIWCPLLNSKNANANVGNETGSTAVVYITDLVTVPTPSEINFQIFLGFICSATTKMREIRKMTIFFITLLVTKILGRGTSG